MIDCPGSLDEEANLALARAIRRAGMETVVPAGGSVRSGAVELWLAGTVRRAAPDAEFGVHSWADEYRSEEHRAELQSLMRNSYAVICWQKINNKCQIRLSIYGII